MIIDVVSTSRSDPHCLYMDDLATIHPHLDTLIQDFIQCEILLKRLGLDANPSKTVIVAPTAGQEVLIQWSPPT